MTIQRTKLKQLGSNDRFTFTGQFVKYGYKTYKDHYAPTLLLKNIKTENHPNIILTDHLWFNLTKGFQKLGLLTKNETIQFNARVNDYYKGYFTSVKKHDFKLSYPTKIKSLTSPANKSIPKDNQEIIGMIMALNFDFYVKNNRPVDNYYLDAFYVWQKSNPLGIEHHTAPDAYIEPNEVPEFDFYNEYTKPKHINQDIIDTRKKRRAERNKITKDWLNKNQKIYNDFVNRVVNKWIVKYVVNPNSVNRTTVLNIQSKLAFEVLDNLGIINNDTNFNYHQKYYAVLRALRYTQTLKDICDHIRSRCPEAIKQLSKW